MLKQFQIPMKKVIGLVVLLTQVLYPGTIMAQWQQVISSSGGQYSNGNLHMSYTLGEPNIMTLNSSKHMLTQGFQQSFKVKVNLKAFIEGYYTGGGAMTPALNNQGQSNALTETDTMVLELHQAVYPYNLAYSATGVLQTNGTLSATFSGITYGENYYVVLKHRNATEVWSAAPVTLSASTYDFTTAASKAYGDNQVEVENGVWAIFSGDINQDGSIDAFDYLLLDPDVFNGAGGYLTTDLNGDGSVDAFDYLILDPHVYNGDGASKP